LKNLNPSNGKNGFWSSWNFIKDESDEVIGMVAVDKDAINDSQVLVVTENGWKTYQILTKMEKMFIVLHKSWR
jgi:hypothetical protein